MPFNKHKNHNNNADVWYVSEIHSNTEIENNSKGDKKWRKEKNDEENLSHQKTKL